MEGMVGKRGVCCFYEICYSNFTSSRFHSFVEFLVAVNNI